MRTTPRRRRSGPPRRRAWLFRALAIALSSLTTFVLFEAWARIAAGRARTEMVWSHHEDELCTQPSSVPGLIFEYRPNKCGCVYEPPTNCFNSRGFPDVERSPAKPPGTKRIAVIGDSVAQGIHVERERTFAVLLERQLNEASSGVRYEVLVQARSGYGTAQELVVFENDTFDYAPDLVLWVYCLNDPAHPLFDNPSALINQYHYRPRSYALHWIERQLFQARRRYIERTGECSRGERLDTWAEYLHCVNKKDVALNLARVADIANHRAPIVFAIHPLMEGTPTWDSYPSKKLHAELAELARKNGMMPLDLADAFRAEAPADVFLPDDQWHLNERGHQRLAAFLYERLASPALIDRSPSAAP